MSRRPRRTFLRALITAVATVAVAWFVFEVRALSFLIGAVAATILLSLETRLDYEWRCPRCGRELRGE